VHVESSARCGPVGRPPRHAVARFGRPCPGCLRRLLQRAPAKFGADKVVLRQLSQPLSNLRPLWTNSADARRRRRRRPLRVSEVRESDDAVGRLKERCVTRFGLHLHTQAPIRSADDSTRTHRHPIRSADDFYPRSQRVAGGHSVSLCPGRNRRPTESV
jgi:hypothetical protein